MGNELKWLLKEGVGVFESCDISLENTPTSHAIKPSLEPSPPPQPSSLAVRISVIRTASNDSCSGDWERG